MDETCSGCGRPIGGDQYLCVEEFPLKGGKPTKRDLWHEGCAPDDIKAEFQDRGMDV